MAEPESDYSWVFGLVVLFFIFVLPILKKVADALSGKKEQQSRAAGQHQREPQKRGALGEMLDGVEGYFRKARAGQEEKPGPASGPTERRVKERTPFDMAYEQRKREKEERRRQRDEKRGRKRLETEWRPEPPQPRPVLAGVPSSETSLREPSIKPVMEKGTGKLSTIGEGLGRGKITSFEEEKRIEIKEESFFEVLGELPEMARMIVLSEVLSQPKSVRSAVEGF